MNLNLFQPAGESVVINSSNDSTERSNSCSRYNVMRNDARSILPCLNDKIGLAFQQQQQQPHQIKRDSGYGSSPDSETVELQAFA